MAKKEIETVLGSGQEANGQSDPELTRSSGLIRGNEVLDPNSVEVRFGDPDFPERKDLAGLGITIEIADLERDSQAVAEIYGKDSVISHLAGVAPGMLNEERYKELREKYGLLIAATSEGVKGYYTKHTDETLYVAKTKDGKVVGVVTSQPEGVGVTIVNVGRLAVYKDEDKDEDYRRHGVATKLVEKVRDDAFKNPQMTQIGAAILRDVDRSDVAFLFFSSLGFKLTGQVDQTCISWDPKTNDFLNRGSWRMALHRSNGSPQA